MPISTLNIKNMFNLIIYCYVEKNNIITTKTIDTRNILKR